VACASNCPSGATTGTITATLTQNDQTGVVAGTYAIGGLPNISGGNISTKQFDVLSGQFLQVSFTDSNGNLYVLAGGPGGSTAGLGLDRSFNGLLIELHDATPGIATATYTAAMSH
jgi:hypothetical protein